MQVIFLPYLALGVTKEKFNKRSAPHTWHGTILDLLDTHTEFKGLGQYAQNCLLILMPSALPQIPKATDSFKKSQKSQLDKMLDKVPKQLTRIYSYIISLENLYLYLAGQEQKRIGFSSFNWMSVAYIMCWTRTGKISRGILVP